MIGGIINESKKVDSDYTVVERDEIVYVDTTNNPVTITLETPTNDNVVYIKDLGNASNNNITITSDKTIDGASNFVINKDKESTMIAYFVDGSVSEFKTLSNDLKLQNIEFIWITDGLGWHTTKRPLEETFNNNNYVFNLKMLEDNILYKVVINE